MSTTTRTRIKPPVRDILLSGLICVGLFLLSSVGVVIMISLVSYIPERFETPSLVLYLLALTVAAYYAWRFITKRFNKTAEIDEDVTA